MSKEVTVYKGRTVDLYIDLDLDVSGSTFESEIREAKSSSSVLIATWDVTFVTDGTDGKLKLTLDNSVTALITQSVGYMDVKEIRGGEPYPVFDDVLDVVFKDVVTI